MAVKPKSFRYRAYTTSSQLRLNPKRRNAKLRKRLGLPPPSYAPRIEITDTVDPSSSSSTFVEAQPPLQGTDEPDIVLHRDGCTCPRGRSWGDEGGVAPCLKGVEKQVMVGHVMASLGISRWDKEEWDAWMKERRERIDTGEGDVEFEELKGRGALNDGDAAMMEVEIRPPPPVG